MEETVAPPRVLGVPRRFATGFFLTIVGIVAAHALASIAGPEAALQRIAIVLVVVPAVFAGVHGGRLAGLVSGALGGVYAVFFFVTFGSRDEVSERIAQGVVIGLTIASLSLLVGHLRTRADVANERALSAERDKAHAAKAAATELSEANAELRRANDALSSVNEGLEAFSYVVAHDLKEPVRAMAALLEDAEDEAVKPVVRENVHAARLANERLAKLLTGLLEVARVSRVDDAQLKPVHPIEVLQGEDCLARYAALRDERGARIETSSLLGTPPALATEEHLCQILGNLILNAIRHSPRASPVVRVRVAPQDAEGAMVLVSVEDDGPGFPAGMIDRFMQGQKRSLMTRGGFGLVIVRRAVERLGGKVWFSQSQDLGGAAVHFTLPSAPVGAKEKIPRASTGAAASAQPPR